MLDSGKNAHELVIGAILSANVGVGLLLNLGCHLVGPRSGERLPNHS